MPTIGEQTNDSRIHYYWIYAANNCQFWNVHFVIYIFVLDIYCQLFGRYMSVGYTYLLVLDIYCQLLGVYDSWRVYECTLGAGLGNVQCILCVVQLVKYRVPPKKCPIATCSLNLFQRFDYTFSYVVWNQNFKPDPSKHFKHTHPVS